MEAATVEHPWRALGAVLMVLGAYNVARSTLLDDGVHLLANVTVAAAIVVIAAFAGVGAADLGLARSTMSTGLRWGVVAAAVISAVVVAAGAIPATRSGFEDPRVLIGGGELLWRALVVIPLGTVIAEELVFRGVVMGLLLTTLPAGRAVVISAVMFGVWHVVPARLDGGSWGLVATTLAATSAAGVGFGWLRLRSRSLLAPIGAHLATNSTTLVVAWWWFGR